MNNYTCAVSCALLEFKTIAVLLIYFLVINRETKAETYVKKASDS